MRIVDSECGGFRACESCSCWPGRRCRYILTAGSEYSHVGQAVEGVHIRTFVGVCEKIFVVECESSVADFHNVLCLSAKFEVIVG